MLWYLRFKLVETCFDLRFPVETLSRDVILRWVNESKSPWIPECERYKNR